MVLVAGDVIPEGAGTYVVADRVHLKQATVTLSHDGKSVNASAGKLLTCEYTGKGINPDVTLVIDDQTLEEGIDYEVTSCEHNTQVGEATIKLKGIGDYYGVVTVPFKIEDTGAYAFLYQNGLLYLKHGNEKPSASVVSSSTKLLLNARWFDSHTAMSGAEVPWASQAAKVKKVVIDKSFFACAPVTCASWFDGCTALTSIKGLENIDTYDVKSMAYMFCDCTALTELSLSGLDTSHVKSFAGMVRGCKKLERLMLGDLDLSCATSTSGFLTGCSSLKELVCGDEFVNAKATAARLAFDKEVFRTKLAGTTSYKRIAKGTAVPAGSATYRLRDLALQFAKVEMTKGTFTCTGKALKPSMVVKLGSITLKNGTDYSIAYANNVYPGKAKGTITGKGVFSGGLVVPFTIKARVTHVGDRLVYKNSQATYTLKVTKVSKNGLVAEAELIDVKVLKGTTAELALPSQCTIGGVTVSLTTISSKLKGTFRNVTTVIIGAKVTKIGARAFAKTPKVKKLIVKSARLTSVKNCLAGSKVTRVQTKVSLTKAKRLKYKVWFTQQSGRSGVTISFG